MSLNKLTISKAHEGLVAKDFSAGELTRACLEEIEKQNGEINAFVSVTAKDALRRAEETDAKISQGQNIGVLEGIPLAVKDNILIAGTKTTAGSKMLLNYLAPYDATVIKKLKEAGAVFLGKTNMDEFAMGSSTETSYFGPTKNPRDLERVAGGSSGGSAAAVAGEMCLAALGSDTGGSIRQPAGFCGVVGLKPTYGRVSRYGLLSMASSFDQIGPLAKNAEDAEILFQAIAGQDPLDSTSVKEEKSRAGKADKKIKIGVIKNINPMVSIGDKEENELVAKSKNIFSAAIKKFQEAGATIEELELPHINSALAVYYVLMPAEISSNLARYDGIKYGYSAADKSIGNLIDVYLKSRREGFGDEVRRRIMIGTYVLSAGYYDAYYLRAQKIRALIKNDFAEAFGQVDAIITPTTSSLAFKIGEKFSRDPMEMYLSDIYTVPANIAGLPAVSLPAGFAEEGEKKLPIGLQILGKWFGEETIFQLAKAYEKISN